MRICLYMNDWMCCFLYFFQNIINRLVITDYVVSGDRNHFLIKEAKLGAKYTLTLFEQNCRHVTTSILLVFRAWILMQPAKFPKPIMDFWSTRHFAFNNIIHWKWISKLFFSSCNLNQVCISLFSLKSSVWYRSQLECIDTKVGNMRR